MFLYQNSQYPTQGKLSLRNFDLIKQNSSTHEFLPAVESKLTKLKLQFK